MQKYGWELPWKGKTFVCCRGRLFFGPVKFWFMFVINSLIIAIASYNWILMKESLFLASHAFLYYLVWALAILTLSFYMCTAFTDPGVLLRN